MRSSPASSKEVYKMAHIVIKDEERRKHEEYVRRSFGVRRGDRAAEEQTEVIAAKTREALEHGRKIGGRKSWSF